MKTRVRTSRIWRTAKEYAKPSQQYYFLMFSFSVIIQTACENISACLCFRLRSEFNSASFFVQVFSRLICLCCLQFEQMSLYHPILVFWWQWGKILVNPFSKSVEGIRYHAEMSFLCCIHFLEQTKTSQMNWFKISVSSYSISKYWFCIAKIQVCLLNLECFHFDPRSNVHLSMFLSKSFSFNETMCSHQIVYFLFYKGHSVFYKVF